MLLYYIRVFKFEKRWKGQIFYRYWVLMHHIAFWFRSYVSQYGIYLLILCLCVLFGLLNISPTYEKKKKKILLGIWITTSNIFIRSLLLSSFFFSFFFSFFLFWEKKVYSVFCKPNSCSCVITKSNASNIINFIT